MGVWNRLCRATAESSHTKVVNMDDLEDRLRESFESLEDLLYFLQGRTVATDDAFWREQIAEDDRLAIEGLRDHAAWEESNRREREEMYRRAMAGLHPGEQGCAHFGSEVRIDWLKEGF